MICHFERTFRFIIDESKAKLSFRNDAVCLFEMTDGFHFEMKHDCLFDIRQGIFSLCLLSKGQSFFLSYKKDRFSANERAFRNDNDSLKDIKILSFQKERLLSQANVLILIYKGQSSFRATQDDIASRNRSFH